MSCRSKTNGNDKSNRRKIWTYFFLVIDRSDITIDQLIKTISEHGFTAEVKEGN